MTTKEFIQSRKGQKRIMAIAKQMNNAHRICMNQCIEFATEEVKNWFNLFNPNMEAMI